MQGDRPTTQTTSTSTETTVTKTTTTTTFHCTRVPSTGEERIMCGAEELCIREAWFCDGETDCGNGFDEQGCASTQAPPEKEKICRVGQVFCADGIQCRYKAYECDGEVDCNDGSDESECKSTKAASSRTIPTTSTTTTTTTTTKTRTTYTMTSTTTTQPACVTSKKCPDMFMFNDASTATPLFQTIANCRLCVNPDKTIAHLCAASLSIGCEIEAGNIADEAKVKKAHDKITAEKSGTLTISIAAGVNEDDALKAVRSKIDDSSIAASSLVDIEFYGWSTRNLSRVRSTRFWPSTVQ
jgi:hypothetical protein